jgi:hypothetical protein
VGDVDELLALQRLCEQGNAVYWPALRQRGVDDDPAHFGRVGVEPDRSDVVERERR